MGKKVTPKFSGYLYQWTKYEEDFDEVQRLQRKGGNSAAAKRLAVINKSFSSGDTKPRWLVCARVKEGRWIVDAICKLRPPSSYEKDVHAKELREGRNVSEEYVYLDEDNSFLLSLPKEKGVFDPQLHKLLEDRIKLNGGQLEGANGLEIQIDDFYVERLKKNLIMTIDDRIRQLGEVGSYEEEREYGFPDQSAAVSSGGNAADTEEGEISGKEQTAADSGDLESEPDLDEITKAIDEECANLEGQDVDAVVKRRVGQGIFRNLLLDRFDGACCMTGLTNPRLLIASHIVPWSESTGTQKLDPENGLLLSVSMDALFDKGLISFSSNGRILIGNDLDAEAIEILGLEKGFALPERLLTDARTQNLAKHRKRHGFEPSL